jgi:hypothetical protein
MYTRTIALTIGVTAMLVGAAFAQPYNGIADCERHAKEYYKASDSGFKSFVIDPKTVDEIAFEGNVGTQHVAAIWRGRATYVSQGRKVTGTFICLHAGGEKGALFIHLIPR